MGNNLEDDFTPEEKSLLKREMRHRIEQQRQREQNPFYRFQAWGRAKPLPWKIGYGMTGAGLVLFIASINTYSVLSFGSGLRLAQGLIAATVLLMLLGLALMVRYWD